MSPTFTIRIASAGDLPAILTLQSTVPQVVNWGEALWLRMLQETDQRTSHRCVWLAESEGSAVGFAVLGGAMEICELEMVVVALHRRGTGIGRALCETAMQWAAKNGANLMELDVRASNHMALQMYASFGFVQQGLRRDYYRNPAEDAVLLGVSLRALELPPSKV